MASTDFTPPHVYEQPYPAFDINAIETPAYVVDVALLRRNMEKLAQVQSASGARVLLALKGFSMFSVFPIMREYLSGCCASGLNEALLAQEFGKEVHVYSPAFKEHEMRQIIPISHHLSFNSLAQFRKFKPMLDAAKAATGHAPSPGIRVNPEHSEVEVSLYDPCSPGCRLGIRSELLEGEDLSGIEGLHFHALCEQDSDVLERTVAAAEKRFPKLLEQVQWVNMGGGHHITRKDYDVERLIRVLRTFREKWGKDVYIEPGEAAGLNTGYLIAEVQDIIASSKTTVAISQPQTTLRHAQSSTDSFTYRTPGDARSLARELYRRLQDDARAADRADAAERLHAEAESIFAWAQASGCLISPSVFEARTASLDELEGGSEHEVLLDEKAGRVLKMTLPPNFGARGQALAYLENMLAYDSLLGFEWCFEGVLKEPDGLSFITSQPFVVGAEAGVEQIEAYLSGQGFIRKREHTFLRALDGITIADARPANMLRDAQGNIFPIDIHILGAGPEDLLEAAAEEEEACEAQVVPTVILDISATAHMPDTLEMPYRPYIFGAGFPGEHPYEYKMGGTSCLAGDVLQGFSFPEPLRVGQRLVFADMAHYTMVKTTTFNGVPHPDIAIYDPATKEYRVVRRFGYADFRNKLS